uniref:Uncharacterized protein n=1 Tax=Timema cristinae TaxID=61476 RepID=A0A7R9CU42_TIMCR|nr:unnamed protein product [Timema cristinae]
MPMVGRLGSEYQLGVLRHCVLLPIRAVRLRTNYANGFRKYTHNCVEGECKTLYKTTLSTPDLDSNHDLPVIGSLVYCMNCALDLAAIEAGYYNMWPHSQRRHSRSRLDCRGRGEQGSNLTLYLNASTLPMNITTLINEIFRVWKPKSKKRPKTSIGFRNSQPMFYVYPHLRGDSQTPIWKNHPQYTRPRFEPRYPHHQQLGLMKSSTLDRTATESA